MKNEIRKILVIKLLNLAFKICPKGEYKLEFAKFIVNNTHKL